MMNIVFTSLILAVYSACLAAGAVLVNAPDYTCPSQCTCNVAPLHTAPFMSSWIKGGMSADHLNDNEVFDHSAIHSSSGASGDADIPYESQGLQVTCAIYPDTNLTRTIEQLSPETMVLSLLQAATNNCAVIDGDQLANLANLKALHVKGFTPQQERQHDEVTMILADDALKPLLNLQILDLCYVRLVPKKLVQRLKRHVYGPLFTTNMVDMPLRKFLRYADDLEVREVPHAIQNRDEISSNNANGDRRNFTNENLVREEYTVVLLNNQNRDKHVSYESNNGNGFFAPFTSQYNLKYLRIAYAHLEELESEMFVGLLNLRSVVLEHNNIKILPADIFAHTPNLRHLNLGYNSILSLDPKSLQGLSRLQSLNLEYNRLAVTGPATFPYLLSLKTLDLTGNPIKNILSDSFIFVNSTEILTLGSPFVSTEIHADAFNKLTNLKVLKISNYSSTSFKGEFFSGIPNLEELSLHGSILTIDFDAFTKLNKLKKLDFSHCGLTRITVDAFFGLSNLKLLDISNNNISEIIPGAFDHLISLEELYLQNNNLTTLAIGLFTPLKVKILRLNHNPWECTCTLMQLRPTLTNTIIHPGYKSCHVNSKQQTICEETSERIVFDSRVAPKCYSPSIYKHKDVYTVAHRYLKCSKYHWDPLVYTDEPTVATDLPTVHQNQTATTYRNDNRPHWRRWRPLTDYTPMPMVPIDLLNEAETDKLVEVSEDITVLPQSDHTEVNGILEVTTLSKAEYKRRMNLTRNKHRARKLKIKEEMKLQRANEIRRLLQEAANIN